MPNTTPATTQPTHPPVIIIGMHRSGTSLLTRLLEKLGLFVGHNKDDNHEAIFFLLINNRMMSCSGGGWRRPEHFERLIKNEKHLNDLKKYALSKLASSEFESYSGGHFDQFREMPGPWGWKDPRNTYTLPVWLSIFHDAKIINIVRHGVDVAHSLHERYKRRHGQTSVNSIPSTRQNPVATLEGSFALWEKYVTTGHSRVTAQGERALEIKYEDFLNNPAELLEIITEFCSISNNKNQIHNLVDGINTNRAYAYRNNPELVKFEKRVADRLGALGY